MCFTVLSDLFEKLAALSEPISHDLPQVSPLTYTDAVSNQHGFMTSQPHRKRHVFEVFTRSLFNRFISIFESECISKRCTPC